VARLIGWLTSPVESSRRSQGVGLAVLRLLVGLLWLYNVGWKRPPDFGRDNEGQLYRYVQGAVDDPLLAPYSWLLEQVVLPNFTLFGWGVLIVESLLAAFLLTGAYTRLFALVGVAQGLAIGLSVIGTPGEWPWGYYMLIGIHVALFATAAGQYAGVDGARASADPGAPWRGLRVLGLVAAAVGAASLVLALTEDLSASPGPGFRAVDLEVTLGLYNALGAALLLLLGILLVVAAGGRSPGLGLAVGAVAAIATVSIWLQLAGDDVLLGGDGTTAAAFLTVAVGALTLSQIGRARADAPVPTPSKETV
jgi:hypothetical protein